MADKKSSVKQKATICEECAAIKFVLCVMGECKECGKMTDYVSFVLCKDCAKKKNCCMMCEKPLAG